MSIPPLIKRCFVPLALLLAVSTVTSFAQKKEIIQLQRDMAILQEQVRQTDRQVAQLGERMAVFENLLKQNLDTSNKLYQAVAIADRTSSASEKTWLERKLPFRNANTFSMELSSGL